MKLVRKPVYADARQFKGKPIKGWVEYANSGDDELRGRFNGRRWPLQPGTGVTLQGVAISKGDWIVREDGEPEAVMSDADVAIAYEEA